MMHFQAFCPIVSYPVYGGKNDVLFQFLFILTDTNTPLVLLHAGISYLDRRETVVHPVSVHMFASRPIRRLLKRINAFLNKGKLESVNGGSRCLVGNIIFMLDLSHQPFCPLNASCLYH